MLLFEGTFDNTNLKHPSKYDIVSTLKPVHNGTLESLRHLDPWDPKIVVVVVSWSILKGCLFYKILKHDLKMVVVVDRWSLFGEVVVTSGLTVNKDLPTFFTDRTC